MVSSTQFCRLECTSGYKCLNKNIHSTQTHTTTTGATETRRISGRNVGGYKALKQSAIRFNGLNPSDMDDYDIKFTYLDEDGDLITFSTPPEYRDAWRYIPKATPNRPILRVNAILNKKVIKKMLLVLRDEGAATKKLQNVRIFGNKNLERLYMFYAKKNGKERDSFKFFYNDRLLSNEDIPEELGMKEQDVITVKCVDVEVPKAESTSEAETSATTVPSQEKKEEVKENLEGAKPQKENSKKLSKKRKNKSRELSSTFIHGRHTCDGCLKSPIIGFRYHSLDLSDYDLCQDCYAKADGKVGSFVLDELDRDRPYQQVWLMKKGKGRFNGFGNRVSSVKPVSGGLFVGQANPGFGLATAPELFGGSSNRSSNGFIGTKEGEGHDAKVKESEEVKKLKAQLLNLKMQEMLDKLSSDCPISTSPPCPKYSGKVKGQSQNTSVVEEVKPKDSGSDKSMESSQPPSEQVSASVQTEVSYDKSSSASSSQTSKDTKKKTKEVADTNKAAPESKVSAVEEKEDAFEFASDDDEDDDEWDVVDDEESDALGRATQMLGSALFEENLIDPPTSTTTSNGVGSEKNTTNTDPSISVSEAAEVIQDASVISGLTATSSYTTPSITLMTRWEKEVKKLRELGFTNDAKSIEALECLQAANIGVGASEDPIRIESVIEKIFGN